MTVLDTPCTSWLINFFLFFVFVKSRYFTQKAANEKKKKTRKREKEEGERRGDMDTDGFSAESQSDSDMDFAG